MYSNLKKKKEEVRCKKEVTCKILADECKTSSISQTYEFN